MLSPVISVLDLVQEALMAAVSPAGRPAQTGKMSQTQAVESCAEQVITLPTILYL